MFILAEHNIINTLIYSLGLVKVCPVLLLVHVQCHLPGNQASQYNQVVIGRQRV